MRQLLQLMRTVVTIVLAQEQDEYQLAHNVPGRVEEEENEEELINLQSSQTNRSRTHEKQSRNAGDYVNMNAWTNPNQSRSKSRIGKTYESWYKWKGGKRE